MLFPTFIHSHKDQFLDPFCSPYILFLLEWLLKNLTSHHFNADHCQLYLPLKQNNSSYSLECLKEIKGWLTLNFLDLKGKKTEVIVFGPSGICDTPSIDLGKFQTSLASAVTNLGLVFDHNFMFDKQVYVVVKSNFYHLRLSLHISQ